MRTISLQRPGVGADRVTFRWTVDPDPGLYARESFDLRFGGELDPAEVPEDVWWTVALLCLHNHWALLRPCRVELPVELAAGEREFWLRLLEAAVATLELTWGGRDLARTIEIDDRGPRLVPTKPATASPRPVVAFSGGKDSLAHLGLLRELGERPLAVTTTSPMWPLVDHASPRRRTAIETVAALPEVSHVEVRSNFRECWDNSFPHRRGYAVATNELSDTMLYTAAAFAVAWARGASEVLLASEAELQLSVIREGLTVQHPHFMYSAATQRSLSRLLARRGITLGSLTYAVRAWQVGHLLWSRYPQLRRLQYSCWRHERGEGACSTCSDCLTVAMTALAAGVAPSRAGIDIQRLLERMGEWQPQLEGGELPDEKAKRELHGSTVRQLAMMRTRVFAWRLARHDPGQLARRGTLDTLRRYSRLRGWVAPAAASVPAPGYRPGWLAMGEERRRHELKRILDSHFARAPETEYGPELERARRLIARNVAPLQRA